MKELKTVTMLLGTMLTKEELDDFMAEADAVSKLHICISSFNSLCSFYNFSFCADKQILLSIILTIF